MTAEEQRAAERERLERVSQQDRWSDAAIDREPVIGRRGMRRLLWASVGLLAVALLVVLPPLVNVSRYQHRVASSISGSIGRPVRFDNISLHMLPFPGFTIENFVVYEDPSFGAEPAMRANRVDARIRLSSLWRRRVEMSHITLESPTVNLVRNRAGYWNMQGVVTQAAQVRSAPTAQARAGDAPRFPYIEGSDARVNLKLDETKLPYALVDAEFALWLPNEQEWHLRMVGRPLRSDTDASDVGQLRMEGVLSRRGANTAQSPFELHASWKPTPLGEASKILLGRDAGWRGMASMEADVNGTPGDMRVTTDMHVHDLRRAEFVPALAMQMDAHCEAEARGMGRVLAGVHCTMPTGSTSLLETLSLNGRSASAPDALELSAEVPDATRPETATVRAALPRASAAWGMRWMGLLSRRMLTAKKVGGTFSLQAAHLPGEGWTGTMLCHCTLPADGAHTSGQDGWAVLIGLAPMGDAMPQAKVEVRPDTAAAETREGAAAKPVSDSSRAATPLTEKPVATGTLAAAGTSFEYASAGLVPELATAVPALTDDMPRGLSGAVTSFRVWGERQRWAEAAEPVVPVRRRRVGRR